LGRARSLGLLGPGAVEDHVAHAGAFADAWHGLAGGPPDAVLDLGSGGGLPGLVLALRWPEAAVVLLDASGRRGEFLTSVLAELGLAPRAQVVVGRAEVLARSEALEGSFPLVTARSFGKPATTAECAARFLGPGGWLLVAEPPLDPAMAEPSRWSPEGLATLGLGAARSICVDPSIVGIPRLAPCPAQYPRRDGVPAKRPLF
jgi:16S rRNA (guanine527-N7)-methyltransferase